MSDFEEMRTKGRAHLQLENIVIKRRLLEERIYEIIKTELPKSFNLHNKSTFNSNLEKLERLMVELEVLEKNATLAINDVLIPFSLSSSNFFYLAKISEEENTPIKGDVCYSKEGFVLARYDRLFGKKDVIAIIKGDEKTYISYDDKDKSVVFNRNKSIELSRDVWEKTELNYHDYLECFGNNYNQEDGKKSR